METPVYNLSKDYGLLFEYLQLGFEAACFVDKKFDIGKRKRTFRDIARVRRNGEFEIDIGVRGISYGSIMSHHKYESYNPSGLSEKEVFRLECERLNLEWIKP